MPKDFRVIAIVRLPLLNAAGFAATSCRLFLALTRHGRGRFHFRCLDPAFEYRLMASPGPKLELGRVTYRPDTILMEKVQVAPGKLAGAQPTKSGIRERTGCSVVAVERGDDVVVEFDADFRFEASDVLYVAGSPEATRRFAETV